MSAGPAAACRYCRWFYDGTTCKRFPQHELVSPDHWCGEYTLRVGYWAPGRPMDSSCAPENG